MTESLTQPNGKVAGEGAPAPETAKEGAPAPEAPDPEVPAGPVGPGKAQRRQFSAEYKRQILQEADACTVPGALGALLRREGLYASHLASWRRQRDRGELQGLAPTRRGRKANPEAAELERLRRENARLRERLAQAETIIDVHKKVSQLLGVPLPPEREDR
jgi:transposase-like protein